MCDWCVTHGKGKKWYLNMQNHARELMETKERVDEINRFYETREKDVASSVYNVLKKLENPSAVDSVRRELEAAVSRHLQTQIVTVEDARAILKLASPIAKVACACRRRMRARDADKVCLALGFMADLGKEWPDYTRGGVDYVSTDEAIEYAEKMGRKGYVHNVHSFMMPYVAFLCHCEVWSCDPLYRRRAYGDLWNFYCRKAEYVATVELDQCIGCGKCVARCQFGALTLSRDLGKVILDMRKCFGCGVCRAACENEAIRMLPRSENPVVKDMW